MCALSVWNEQSILESDLGVPRLRGVWNRASNYDTLCECPRKFMLSVRFGLRPKTYQPALFTGEIYHRTLAFLQSGLTFDQSRTQVEEYWHREEEKVADCASEAGFLPNGQDVQSALNQLDKDFTLGIAMAKWTWEYAPWDPQRWEVLSVEELLILNGFRDVPNATAIKLDSLLLDKKSATVWIGEHKTTSFDTAQRSSVLLYEFQPWLYTRVFKSWFSEHGHSLLAQRLLTFGGIKHGLIKKPGIRLKKNQTWTEFVQELHDRLSSDQKDWDTAQARQGKMTSGPPFLRSTIPSGRSSSLENEKNFQNLSSATRCVITPQKFPRCSASCFHWNTPCKYLRICKSPKTDWKALVRDHYVQENRDQLDIGEAKGGSK